MSYQALYRKWRPSGFGEMVGQDAVVTTLKNQIRSGRVGHAYLFCGTRGTGKTSAAKIFARAVNCPNAAEHDGNPCNECETCRAIASGSAMNVFEIDAASNNGVDNIRDIREQIEYPPVKGSYKVYIIDEVHMLSQGAFNALLKTLEEPPAYVIFILATTDPQKIPATILSRCQRYDFRRISRTTIAAHLKEIIDREGIQAEDRALGYIAEAADGSMRDSLSILDQCLAYHYGDVLSYGNVLDILGAADDSVYSKLYNQLISHDAEGAIETAAGLNDAGCEPGVIISEFVRHLRDVLIVKSSQSREAADISDEKYELAMKDADAADRDTLIYIISAMSELANRLRFSSQKRIGLEVELIRLSALGTRAMKPGIKNDSADAGRSSVQTDVPWGLNGRRQQDTAVNAYGGAYQAVTANSGSTAAYNSLPGASARIHVNISDNAAGQSRQDAHDSDTRAAHSKMPQEPADSRERTAMHTSDGLGMQDKSSALLTRAGSSGPAADIAAEGMASDNGQQEADQDINGILDIVTRNWSILLSELSAANRPLFNDVVMKEEHGNIVLVFKNKMNFRLAAGNSDENGLIRLRELAQEKLGMRINFRAREAKPGEMNTDIPRATQEELAKINFPISIED